MQTKNSRLYQLLPAHIRKQCVADKDPLGDLLSIIGEQVDVVEADIAQLYENWFIETCQDWVVPYLGELIGCSQPSRMASEGNEGDSGEFLGSSIFQRRDVANTIRNRKRKGTLALLEDIAHDIAGWPARVVEFEELLLPTQMLHHFRPGRGNVIDLRTFPALNVFHGPFDRLARNVDIRTEQPRLASGRYQPNGVGLFVCRLPTYSVTRTVAYCVEEEGANCYTFSVLGNDSPLFTAHEKETDPTHLAAPLNLPLPLRRGWLTDSNAEEVRGIQTVNEEYYGEGKSFAIYTQYQDTQSPVEFIPPDRIIPADLSQWHYRPPEGYVAVDPELGRIVFPPNRLPEGVLVSYIYGFGADIGGGEYSRPFPVKEYVARAMSAPGQKEGQGPVSLSTEIPKRYVVSTNLTEVLEQWRQEAPKSAIIEIQENHIFEEPINLSLLNQSLEIRSATGKRPIIRLVDWLANRPDMLKITGAQKSRFVLDGVLITGRGLELKGTFSEVKFSHSTLVPGWGLEEDCAPKRSTEPSVTLNGFQGHLCLQKSICGPIRVISENPRTSVVNISVVDCILDAMNVDRVALGDEEYFATPVIATIQRSTIIGKCLVQALPLAENSIFLGQLLVERRQKGCLRYCYVHPDSLTPKQFRCQPELAIAQVTQSEKPHVEKKVRPSFTSLRYGSPWYAQLSQWCGEEISRGGENEGEMGVFYHRWQAQRTANLMHRLEEAVPFGTEISVIPST